MLNMVWILASHAHGFVWESSKQNVMTKNGEKMVTRKVRVKKMGTVNDLVTELKEELDTLPYHLFMKKWQQDPFTNLITNLPD